MNSRTWWVDHDGARSIAKWVPVAEGDHLVAGVEAARIAGASGLRTGTARPLADGRDTLEAAGGRLVVLEMVPGVELTGDSPGDAESVGRTLAAAHRATLGRSAVRDAVRAVASIDPEELTLGVCHGDPAPCSTTWPRL